MDLIYKLLKTPNFTLSNITNTTKEIILPPILCNIYLHKLDV